MNENIKVLIEVVKDERTDAIVERLRACVVDFSAKPRIIDVIETKSGLEFLTSVVEERHGDYYKVYIQIPENKETHELVYTPSEYDDAVTNFGYYLAPKGDVCEVDLLESWYGPSEIF